MSTVVDLMLTIRGLVRAIADRLQWLPPTLARFVVGSIFLWTGWGKLHNLDRIIEYFGRSAFRVPSCWPPSPRAPSWCAGR